MGRLSNISGKEAVKAFSKIGYYLARQEGSHQILYNDRPGYPILVIPAHKELAPALLRAQIKRAGLSIQGFLKLKKGK
jgi:predicted RNA binding protein YcfA (HicA-like mRNA interferase family)